MNVIKELFEILAIEPRKFDKSEALELIREVIEEYDAELLLQELSKENELCPWCHSSVHHSEEKEITECSNKECDWED